MASSTLIEAARFLVSGPRCCRGEVGDVEEVVVDGEMMADSPPPPAPPFFVVVVSAVVEVFVAVLVEEDMVLTRKQKGG